MRMGNPAVKPLISALNSPNREIRRQAAAILEKIGAPAVSVLMEALDADRASVRASAVRALGLIGDRQAVDILIFKLRDDAPEVRRQAAWALGWIGDERAIEPVDRGDIGDGAQRDEVEERHQVRFLASFEEPALPQGADDRNGQHEGDAHGREVTVRGGGIVAVEAVRVDHRECGGEVGRALVMVDDDHIDAGAMSSRQRFMRLGE